MAQMQDYGRTTHPHDAQRSGFLEPKTVDKPWGHEDWLVVTDKYVMKKLYVNSGEQLSKQYHVHKMETLTVLQGDCLLLLGKEGDLNLDNARYFPFNAGEVVHLNPRTIHTFKALTDTVLCEVSTTELSDVVRLEDKYGRQRQ